MDKAPILTTERLVLRPHVHADFEACYALWSDPRTVRFIGGVPATAQDAWFRLQRYGGMWALQGYGFWAVTDRASGAYVGNAGLMEAMRGVEGLDGVPEAGWVLGPEIGGRGLATEAMRAVLGWADAHLEDGRTACIIDPDNAASLRVADKLGYREVGRPLFREQPTVLLYRERGA